MKLFFSFAILFLLFAQSVIPTYAGANKSYTCLQNGGTSGEGTSSNTYKSIFCTTGHCLYADCAKNEVCDDNYANSDGKPCAPFNQLTCTCASSTGTTSFTCGITSNSEFGRSCGSGQVCDQNQRSPWPCTTNANSTNAPTGSLYNPCPNGICDTSLGPITITDPTQFVSKIFQLLLSISGAVALLLMIVSGYQLMLSQGNPEKVKGARERLISAIIGLIFIIFSVAFLQIIGVDILHLQGFSK